MTMCTVPTCESVSAFLESLFGTKVAASLGTTTAFDPKAPLVAAIYASEQGATVGVWLCDLSFAASAAAALCVVPVEQATDAITAGALPDSLMENLKEVFNVGSRFFVGPGAPRVALKSVHSQPLPTEIRIAMAKSPLRVNVDAEITGYPKGRMTLFMS